MDPIFIKNLGMKYDSFMSGFDKWIKQIDPDDHVIADIIEFILEIDDEKLSSYLTDEIYQEANGWEDEHGEL